MCGSERLLKNAKRLADDLLHGGVWYDSAFEIDSYEKDAAGDDYNGEIFERRLRLLSKQIQAHIESAVCQNG